MNLGTAIIFFFLHCVALAGEEMWAVSSRGVDVPFSSWQAEGAGAGTGVLVLVLPTDIWQPNRPGKPGPNHQPTPANKAMTRMNVEHPTLNIQRRTKETAGRSYIFSSTSTFDVGRSMFDVPIPSPVEKPKHK